MSCKKMLKKSISIPYEDGLTYPSVSIAKQAIAFYCAKENISYDFLGETEEDNFIVRLDGIDHEVLRGNFGLCGYSIRCREL